ncbi:MAG: hypothetical protein ACK4TL_14990 [Hyphomicrobiaceae bacterium]
MGIFDIFEAGADWSLAPRSERNSVHARTRAVLEGNLTISWQAWTRRIAAVAMGLVVLAAGTAVPTGELRDLLGKWKWQLSTVEGGACAATGARSRAFAGPKSPGRERRRSKPEKKGDFFVRQVVHPAAGHIRGARLQMKGASIRRLDGGSAANICAHRDFAREGAAAGMADLVPNAKTPRDEA